MKNRHIIYIPGKNPKPPAEQHRSLLWRSLVEGVRRAEPGVMAELGRHEDEFKLIAWNYLYYNTFKDVSRDIPWIDALINKHGPTEHDIQQAKAWHKKFDRLLFTIADICPYLIRFLPEPIRMIAAETNRYFQNKNNIANQIRELVKIELHPLLLNNEKILLIGHSLGSVIAYDTLWELSHVDNLPGKVDFLTLGSPLGMNYIQHRMMGCKHKDKQCYPTNIKHWINISAVGDVTALDRIFSDDFAPMLKLGLIESIEDHCEGIYNFYRDDEGLNCHRSYGYLVNPAVGKVIADWWQAAGSA